jgi:hypothetical protein
VITQSKYINKGTELLISWGGVIPENSNNNKYNSIIYF